MAAVTGNTLILKPSERDPGAAMMLAELCQQAGNQGTDESQLHADSIVHKAFPPAYLTLFMELCLR
jgi:Aldehyde dehydrogenase family